MVACQERGSAWGEYASTRSPQLREALITQYAVLARRTVERLQIVPWGCVSREDLLSHAVLGLIDAVDRYDPDQGASFETFAVPRIRGAVLDALRKLDWAPRSVRSDETRLRRAYERLESVLGRAPTDEEVADELGVDLQQHERMVSDLARASITSLDDLVAGMGETVTRGDLVAGNDSYDPYRMQEREAAKRRLVDALEALPEREKLVVALYYYEELTLREIGVILGVTEQRVSQIHAKAMLRLSQKLIRHTELVTALAA